MLKNSKQFFLSIFAIALCTMSCNESSSLIETLDNEEKISNAYHFYPSTLRMLNFTNIESINKLVKNIDQMTLMRMDSDAFTSENFDTLLTDLQSKEDYEIFMEMTNAGFQYIVLGQDSKDKTLLLIDSEEGQFIADIKGTPNLMQIPKIMNDLSAIDSSQTSGFSIFKDLLDQDFRNTNRRKERKRKREQRELEGASNTGSNQSTSDYNYVDSTHNVQ